MASAAHIQQVGNVLSRYAHFIDIKANYYGGAICDTQSIQTKIERCLFEKVETTNPYSGGAVFKKNCNLSVSFSCFFLCISGMKDMDLGGNAIYFNSQKSNITVELSNIMKSSPEVKTDPGDASIFVNSGSIAQFDFLNGSQNFARYSSSGNLLIEMRSCKSTIMKQSLLDQSKGTRVTTGYESKTAKLISCNIINNSMSYFIEYIDQIEDCHIFQNSISKKPTGFNFISCKSDNTYICSNAYRFSTKAIPLINEAKCRNPIEKCETNKKIKKQLVISFIQLVILETIHT